MGLSTKKTGTRGGFTEINVTPLVDVMLVLLIVFMVAAPLLATGLRIDLPEVQAATEVRRQRKVIGVPVRGLELRHVRGDGAEVRGAASDRQALVDVGVEGDEADFVLHAIADVADEDRGVDGVIEPGDLRDARGHAVALVEAEEDLLRAV